MNPADNFVYLQVIFDALLVTAIVHITGGADSPFAFLYILVISSGALLLPLPGGVLVGVLATVLFLADAVWLHLDTFRLEVVLKMGLFATVALVTGLLGDRVRRAGLALGQIESALRQLRLDTGDILANIGTGVMTVDGDGRLMYLNPAGEALAGPELSGVERDEKSLEAVETVAPGMGSVLESSLVKGQPVARFKSVAERKGTEMVLGISTTVLEREAGTRTFGDGHLPGHHGPGAAERPEPPGREAGGRSGTQRLPGPRNQEPPGLHPERRRAAVGIRSQRGGPAAPPTSCGFGIGTAQSPALRLHRVLRPAGWDARGRSIWLPWPGTV